MIVSMNNFHTLSSILTVSLQARVCRSFGYGIILIRGFVLQSISTPEFVQDLFCREVKWTEERTDNDVKSKVSSRADQEVNYIGQQESDNCALIVPSVIPHKYRLYISIYSFLHLYNNKMMLRFTCFSKHCVVLNVLILHS